MSIQGNAGFAPHQLKMIKAATKDEPFTLPVSIENGGTGADSIELAKQNLNVETGVDVQDFNSKLQQIADLTAPTEDKILFYNQGSSSYDFLQVGDNLSIDEDVLNAVNVPWTGVEELDTGVGLTGGPITSTGIIALQDGGICSSGYVEKLDTFTTSSGSFVVVPDLSFSVEVSNTPKSFLIMLFLNISFVGATIPAFVQIRRNNQVVYGGSPIASAISGCMSVPTTTSSVTNPYMLSFVDTINSTGDFLYEIYVRTAMGAGQLYVNRSFNDALARTPSFFSYMEIK